MKHRECCHVYGKLIKVKKMLTLHEISVIISVEGIAFFHQCSHKRRSMSPPLPEWRFFHA